MKRLMVGLTALLLTLCACTQKEPDTAEEPPVVTQYAVRTDWSRLEERERLPAVGSQWYDEYTDHLIPSGEYGQLVPYAGVRVTADWMVRDGCMYGLMTTDGVAVTAPVFSQVYSPVYYEGGGWSTHPLFVLTRHAPEDTSGFERQYAIAAGDGSWCTDFQYTGVLASPEGLLLMEEDGLSTMSPSGAMLGTYSLEELELTGEEWQRLCADAPWGGVLTWEGDEISLDWTDDTYTSVKVFRVDTRDTVVMTYKEWSEKQAALEGGRWSQRKENGETVLTRDGETYRIPFSLPGEDGYGLAEIYRNLVLFNGQGVCAAYTLQGEELLLADNGRIEYIRDTVLGENVPGILALVSYEGEGSITYYRMDGSLIAVTEGWMPLYTSCDRRVALTGGLVELLDLNTASYYDLDTEECIFRTYLGYEST